MTRTTKFALVTLGVFNAAFAVLFGLWNWADNIAVDNSEAHGGFDPSALIPHGDIIFVMFYAVGFLLIVLDVLVIAAIVDERAARAKAQQPARH